MIQDSDWKAWRKAERKRLIAERLVMGGEARQRVASQVCSKLDAILSLPSGAVVSFYWPFKGELNLRSWIVGLLERGFRSALPVVIEKNAPLEFRQWDPDVAMERGIWDIPVPANAHPVTPDVIIAPLVGFDRQGFRLGYGGGYFDRTLAHLRTQPLIIGIGYSASELPSIRPQAHDVPMHLIVTEGLMLELYRTTGLHLKAAALLEGADRIEATEPLADS